MNTRVKEKLLSLEGRQPESGSAVGPFPLHRPVSRARTPDELTAGLSGMCAAASLAESHGHGAGLHFTYFPHW